VRARVNTWLTAGALTLVALAPASAQIARPLEMPNVRDSTGAIINGVLSPTYYRAPQMTTTWIVPQFVVYYQAPQPVYVAMPTPRPPTVAPVSTAVVTLRAGTTPNDLRVKPGTVVIWVNGTERERAIVIRPAETASAASSASEPRGQMVRSNGTFSLVFHETGTYDFYLQDEPERRARLVVAE
jgi:plastocyanin